MKPRYMFAFVIVTLLGGTLFSRYATAGNVDKGEMTFGDTVPQGTFGEASIPMTHIAGTTILGEGEVRALEQITRLLDAEGSAGNAPVSPVGVTWDETYRQRTITLRAYYVPRERALVCGAGTHDIYVYQPVTREGMETALREGRKAPFASANLYSLPHMSAR